MKLWFSPNDDPNDPEHQRQFGSDGNRVFHFNATTKKLIVETVSILANDCGNQYSLYANMEGVNYYNGYAESEKFVDGEHDIDAFRRHTIDGNTKHLIVISCWYWKGVRIDGSTFEEYDRAPSSLPQRSQDAINAPF